MKPNPRVVKLANTEDLKSSEVKPLEGSIPSSGTKLYWCNSHQRRSYNPKTCPLIGGILLPCSIVDLTDQVEILEG